jgi:SAM-dependent methyltransferase
MAACTTCNLCDSPGDFQRSGGCRSDTLQRSQVLRVTCLLCGAVRIALHFTARKTLRFLTTIATIRCSSVSLIRGLRIAYGNRLRLLKQRGLRRTSSILDFGCGSGAFVKFLRRQGYERSSGYDAYAEAYSDPSVLGRRYDLVVSYDVVEHAEDPRARFAELATLLAPGGVLTIGTAVQYSTSRVWGRGALRAASRRGSSCASSARLSNGAGPVGSREDRA